jgi:hypothetical protein
MKTLMIILMLFMLPGCAMISYEASEEHEVLVVKTLFKSLDGLWAERTRNEGFSIVIDKTYTHDPIRGMAALLETYQELYGMGLRLAPEVITPLLPDEE